MPRPAPAFEARPALRLRIERAGATHGTVLLTRSGSGGDGVGKTQLAAACARQALAAGTGLVVWADASDPARVTAAYARAARLTGVPEATGEDADADARAFLDWLATTGRRWLIVLDDITDPEALGRWWPPATAAGPGRALATVRHRRNHRSARGRATVEIGPYTPGEAVSYLRRRLTAAGRQDLLDDRVTDLAEALDRHPLALSQAAAYLLNMDTPCAAYLTLFRSTRSRSHPTPSPPDALPATAPHPPPDDRADRTPIPPPTPRAGQPPAPDPDRDPDRAPGPAPIEAPTRPDDGTGRPQPAPAPAPGSTHSHLLEPAPSEAVRTNPAPPPDAEPLGRDGSSRSRTTHLVSSPSHPAYGPEPARVPASVLPASVLPAEAGTGMAPTPGEVPTHPEGALRGPHQCGRPAPAPTPVPVPLEGVGSASEAVDPDDATRSPHSTRVAESALPERPGPGPDPETVLPGSPAPCSGPGPRPRPGPAPAPVSIAAPVNGPTVHRAEPVRLPDSGTSEGAAPDPGAVPVHPAGGGAPSPSDSGHPDRGLAPADHAGRSPHPAGGGTPAPSDSGHPVRGLVPGPAPVRPAPHSVQRATHPPRPTRHQAGSPSAPPTTTPNGLATAPVLPARGAAQPPSHTPAAAPPSPAPAAGTPPPDRASTPLPASAPSVPPHPIDPAFAPTPPHPDHLTPSHAHAHPHAEPPATSPPPSTTPSPASPAAPTRPAPSPPSTPLTAPTAPTPPTALPPPARTTHLLCLAAAQDCDPVGLAAPALRLAAALGPGAHPAVLWTGAAFTRHLGDATGGEVDPGQARDAVRLLHRYGLLGEDPQPDGPSLVRVHARTVRVARLKARPTARVLRAAADALHEHWPETDHTDPELALVLASRTRLLAADPSEALWSPAPHPVLARAGHCLNALGLHRAAAFHWQHLARRTEDANGPDHPATLAHRTGLATAYALAGYRAEALELKERLVADHARLAGPEAPATLSARIRLAGSYLDLNRFSEAAALLEEVVAAAERTHGPAHPETLGARAHLAGALTAAGRTEEALVLEEENLDAYDHLLGRDHPDTLTCAANLGIAYWTAGRYPEALALQERAGADHLRLLGPDHPDTLVSLANLAVTLRALGREEEARARYATVTAALERVLGPDHPRTRHARTYLTHWPPPPTRRRRRRP
ncbi:tetratricopeptide repeat protein [Streptomyces sp. NPDC097619]|uniref:tetratricopeptide repeat protein n=1 Tax=Streptomyces sp. NPDC097619 TaxID=3157228 RepID=UPI00332C3F7F